MLWIYVSAIRYRQKRIVIRVEIDGDKFMILFGICSQFLGAI